jgi:glycosyltransferase 2 family protein
MRASIRTAAILALSLGLLALFLRHTDLRQVWTEVTRARLDLLLLALGVTALTYLLRALRWQYLLAPIGHVRLSNAFRTTVIGFAATALLPARAGEVLRPWLLARKEGLSATAAFATIILERVLDTVTVLLLFGLFLLLASPAFAQGDPVAFSRLKLGGLLAALLSVAALAVMFVMAGHPAWLNQIAAGLGRILPQRLAGALAAFLRTFAEGLAIVRQPGRLVVSILLSLPLWLSIATGIWCVSAAFHIALPFLGSFLIMALLVIGVAVPTPGAVGGFHYFYRLGVTAFYSAPNDRAVGAAIVLHAVSFVPVAIAGLFFLAQEGLSLTRAGSLVRSGEAGEAA